MVRRTVTIAALLTLLLGSFACAVEPWGATIVFAPNDILVYEGTGESRVAEPTAEPVTVGNFVIERVLRPSNSDLGDFGLTMRYRTGPAGTLVNTQTWGWVESRQGLHLRCRAVDPEAPIGFWVRAHVTDRSQRQAWLYLDVGPNAWNRQPAVTANRRCHTGPQCWYVPLDLDDIYAGDRGEQDEFSIVLGVGGWGAYAIDKLEIRPYKTQRAE